MPPGHGDAGLGGDVLEAPIAQVAVQGDWRFEDITAKAGVAMTGRHSTGAVFADVDGDGDLDLLVSTLGGGVALVLNDGHGVFTERTTEAGLASHAGSMTMTLARGGGGGRLHLYSAH